MKELNNTKIIGLDEGYGNIKTANTVTPTAITSYDTEPIFSGNILEYGGKYYRIGEGHKEFLPDKWVDDDFYLLTLASIAREMHREPFREYLLQNPQVDFRFNKTDYHINFVGCSIYPQGYPAIVEHLADFKGTNLLADIGNGTMNVLYINNKKPVEERSYTEKRGVNQCMIAAKNTVLDGFGIKIEDSIIEQVFRYGTADIRSAYLDCIKRLLRIMWRVSLSSCAATNITRN